MDSKHSIHKSLILPNYSEDLFNFNNNFNKYNLTGDNNQICEIDKDYLNKISYWTNEEEEDLTNKKFKLNIFKNFENDIDNEIKENELNKIKNKTTSSGDSFEDYNSLGNPRDKNYENLIKRKLSIEFLSELYSKGAVDKTKKTKFSKKKIDFNKDSLSIHENNPYVYSFNKLHPFSMFYGTKIFIWDQDKKGTLILPAPRFIDSNDWIKAPDYSFEGIYKGIKVDDKQGLVITDPLVTKKYSGLISNMIWQILKVPFGHHISLMVKMFEPKCLTERLTNVFSFANKYLIPASDPKLSPLERFKLCITYQFSGLYIPAQQLKPFNPFLGETFQGEFENGAKLYVEQVTHSPLAARFYLFYKNIYKVHGYFAFSVTSEGFGSTAYVNQKGPIYITFPQIGEEIICNIPRIKLLNASSEKGRSNMFDTSMGFLDLKNSLRAVIKFTENKKKFHEIKGEIFKYTYPKDFTYVYDKIIEFNKKYHLESHKNKKNTICNIEGSWLGKLFIDKKIYWDIQAQIPEFIRPVKNCIPSDGRYREDLIWLYRSFYNSINEEERKLYEDIAQEWKIMMEKFNREERKIRAKKKK